MRIPQAQDEGPEARAVQSPKACVARLPTKVSQGLLFVWPDEHGWEKAMASETPRFVLKWWMVFFWVESGSEKAVFCFSFFLCQGCQLILRVRIFLL